MFCKLSFIILLSRATVGQVPNLSYHLFRKLVGQVGNLSYFYKKLCLQTSKSSEGLRCSTGSVSDLNLKPSEDFGRGNPGTTFCLSGGPCRRRWRYTSV